MAHPVLVYASLDLVSADIVVIAEYVSDEIGVIQSQYQLNASVDEHLQWMQDVMDLVANRFS